MTWRAAGGAMLLHGVLLGLLLAGGGMGGALDGFLGGGLAGGGAGKPGGPGAPSGGGSMIMVSLSALMPGGESPEIIAPSGALDHETTPSPDAAPSPVDSPVSDALLVAEAVASSPDHAVAVEVPAPPAPPTLAETPPPEIPMVDLPGPPATPVASKEPSDPSLPRVTQPAGTQATATPIAPTPRPKHASPASTRPAQVAKPVSQGKPSNGPAKSPQPAGIIAHSGMEEGGHGAKPGNGLGSGETLGPEASPGAGAGDGAGSPAKRGSGTGDGTGDGAGDGAGDGTGAGAGKGSGIGTSPGNGDGLPGLAPDTPPRLAKRLEPAFPREARQMGVTGTVTVRLLVNAAGGVEQAHVVSATPPGVFEASVLEAVRQWRFLPARRAGKAVAAWVVAPVRFDLRG